MQPLRQNLMTNAVLEVASISCYPTSLLVSLNLEELGFATRLDKIEVSSGL